MNFLGFKDLIAIFTLVIITCPLNTQAQTNYTGIIHHTNHYLTIGPFDSSYDDGTYARLFYDGNNKTLQFWNSGSSIPYTHLSVGNLTANGDISTSGAFTSTGNIGALGNLGIGTLSPESKLHIVKGGQSIKFATGTNSSGYSLDIGVNDDGVNFTNNSGYRGFNFINPNGKLLSISRFGYVGIGTNSPDARLTVKGKIHAKEVKIDLSVPGADYVFKEGYNLISLEDIRQYIKEHGHLPNVPSAKEMEENGVELGVMNMKLLEKIEELTLYLIELKKMNDEQQIQINKLIKSTE